MVVLMSSYTILSSNVVMGSDTVPSYSFVTSNAGTLQVECLDPSVTTPTLEVDGLVKCDTVAFADPTRSRAVATDQFGRLTETTVPLADLELYGSRISAVEGDAANLGSLIEAVEMSGNVRTRVNGNGITLDSNTVITDNSGTASLNVVQEGGGPVLQLSDGDNTVLSVYDGGATVLAPGSSSVLNGQTSSPFPATLGVYGNTSTTGWFLGNLEASNIVTTLLHGSDIDLTGNMDASGVNASAVTLTGNLYAVNGNFSGDVFIAASDQRLKTDIHVIDNALDTIANVHGYTFTWRDDIPGLPLHGSDIGLLAQEVEATRVGSRIVAKAPFDHDIYGNSTSGNGYLTVRYDKLHALEIQCIHELRARVEALEAMLEAKK